MRDNEPARLPRPRAVPPTSTTAEILARPRKFPLTVLVLDELPLAIEAGGTAGDPALASLSHLVAAGRKPGITVVIDPAETTLAMLLSMTASQREFIVAARQARYGWDSIGRTLGHHGDLAGLHAYQEAGERLAWECPGCRQQVTDHAPRAGDVAVEEGHAARCPRLALAEPGQGTGR